MARDPADGAGEQGAPGETGPGTPVVSVSNGPGAPRYYRYQVGQPTGEEVGVPGTTAQTAVELVPKLS